MPITDKLTPVEWEIMEAIWKLGGAPSVRDVLEHAFPEGQKAYTTIQTVMNILEKKGLLKRKKQGLVNFYKPTKSRDQMVNSELSSLVSRMFQGSIPAFANHLIKSDDITLEEIEKIKILLDAKEAELKGNES
ncbi:MAG: BlaI/MecI/CopY family transcriptional regulator [bacterium]|jgi:predicted transcriptional regulator|nr:BlaI/MecI/CopY family transcriptional regulator [bacterium]